MSATLRLDGTEIVPAGRYIDKQTFPNRKFTLPVSVVAVANLSENGGCLHCVVYDRRVYRDAAGSSSVCHEVRSAVSNVLGTQTDGCPLERIYIANTDESWSEYLMHKLGGDSA